MICDESKRFGKMLWRGEVWGLIDVRFDRVFSACFSLPLSLSFAKVLLQIVREVLKSLLSSEAVSSRLRRPASSQRLFAIQVIRLGNFDESNEHTVVHLVLFLTIPVPDHSFSSFSEELLISYHPSYHPYP